MDYARRARRWPRWSMIPATQSVHDRPSGLPAIHANIRPDAQPAGRRVLIHPGQNATTDPDGGGTAI